VSGVLLALAFPPASLGPLALVALVPLLVVLRRGTFTRGVFFRAGYLFGNTFFLAHLWWMVKLIPSASMTIPWLMFPFLILISLYLSVYPGLVFLVTGWLARRSCIALVLIIPAVWGLAEMARSSSDFGFPWGTIANALAPYPALIQSAAFVGLFGLGMFVVLVNAIWSQALVSKGTRAKIGYIIAGTILLGVTTLHGQRAIAGFSESSVDVQEQMTIAIAQPNVDLRVKWKPNFTDSTFRLIERFCREAARTDAEVIVFPETSAPVYIRFQPNYMNLLSRLASELDMGIYIGFLDGRYEGPNDSLWVFNSSALFDKNGAFLQYDKMQLLPFGESIPYAWKFPTLSRLDFGQANFHPGPERSPLRSRIGTIGPMICFESLFPRIARQHTVGGAEVLFNITNDGWFGNSPGPYQHNEMAILRAVENHRYLVRSSNTGISMFVDPVGRIVSSLGLFEEGTLVGTIKPMQRVTFYTRFGDTPVVVGALLMIAIGAVVARRKGPS